MNALVCFHDHGTGRWQRWLRPGFRHVFIVIKCDINWIRIDGFKGIPTVEDACFAGHDLAKFYREENGYRVIELDVDRTPRTGYFMQATCVGMVKAYLALKAPLVFTPWQLHQRIIKELRVSPRGGGRRLVNSGGVGPAQRPHRNAASRPKGIAYDKV